MTTHDRLHQRLPAVAWAILAIALALSPRATAADPAPVKFPDHEEEWFVVKLQDAKCGYMYSISDHVDSEVHTRLFLHFELARGDAKVEITSDQRYRESLEGQPLAFQHETTMGQLPVVYRGAVEGGKLRLVTEQAGAAREAVYDFDPQIRFAWGQLLEQRKRGLAPGTTYSVKTYEPTVRVDGPLVMEVKVHGKEKIDVLGTPRPLYKVTSTLLLPTPITTESWVDDDAAPVIASVDFGIARILICRASKEEALEKSAAPELFLSTFVNVDRRIPANASEVTYRLRLPDKGKWSLPDLPKTSMQTFKRTSAHEGTITVRRLDWSVIRRADASSADPSPELAPFCKASTMLDTDDPRIKRLARRALSDAAAAPADKADALRRFVGDYVSDKGLDVGFATASEVARTRAGDCTEHAALLAALARAAGLPARGVSGIVQIPPGPLMPTKASAFGYHMWTQVHIGGQWVDIDAALAQTECDPTHIALSIMPLNDEGVLDSMTSLFPLLGRLELEVINVKE